MTLAMKDAVLSRMEELLRRTVVLPGPFPVSPQTLAATFISDDLLHAHKVFKQHKVGRGLSEDDSCYIRIALPEGADPVGNPENRKYMAKLYETTPDKPFPVLPEMQRSWRSDEVPLLSPEFVTEDMVNWIIKAHKIATIQNNDYNICRHAMLSLTTVGQVIALLGADFKTLFPKNMLERCQGARKVKLPVRISDMERDAARRVVQQCTLGAMLEKVDRYHNYSIVEAAFASD
jgi:hypothetical protein